MILQEIFQQKFQAVSKPCTAQDSIAGLLYSISVSLQVVH